MVGTSCHFHYHLWWTDRFCFQTQQQLSFHVETSTGGMDERLQRASRTFVGAPSIVVRREGRQEGSHGEAHVLDKLVDEFLARRGTPIQVNRWEDTCVDAERKEGEGRNKHSAQKTYKSSKPKASGSGRTYTSKYRGVHQTFPTRRWEAQFRRAGKPTSLGCFDREEEAARAYDKMMLWCELHNAQSMKQATTNFEIQDYAEEIPRLQSMTQDELVQQLRREGRTQASQGQWIAKAGARKSTGSEAPTK